MGNPLESGFFAGQPLMPQFLDYSLARGDTYVLGSGMVNSLCAEANPET
jgi:hypothetical protein